MRSQDGTSAGADGLGESALLSVASLGFPAAFDPRESALASTAILGDLAGSASSDGSPVGGTETGVSEEAENGPPFLIDEVKAGAKDYVRTYGEKIRRARVRGRELQKLSDPLALKVGKALEKCGSALWVRKYLEAPGSPHRISKMFCCQKALLCPWCGSRISAVHLCRGVSAILSVLDRDAGLCPYLLTLTIPCGPDLRLQAETIWRVVSKALQGRRDFRKALADPGRKAQRWTPFAEFEGGILRGEVKRSRSGEWHYHIHAVILGPFGLSFYYGAGSELPPGDWNRPESTNIYWRVSSPVDLDRTYAQGPLADEWAALLNLPYANLDLQPLRVASLLASGSSCSDVREQLLDELQEVFRYFFKLNDCDEMSQWEAFRAVTYPKPLKQQRAFGCLRGVNLNPAFVDDLEEFEGMPYVEVCYRYLESAGGLVRCENQDVLQPFSEFEAFAI